MYEKEKSGWTKGNVYTSTIVLFFGILSLISIFYSDSVEFAQIFIVIDRRALWGEEHMV